MAELADAYGSGPYESKFMQVQVLLSAPQVLAMTERVINGVETRKASKVIEALYEIKCSGIIRRK